MMIKKMSLYHILMFISSLLLILLPAALISGPFLPDLFITLIALIFFILYNQDKGKEFLVSKTPFFRLFIIFFVFIVIGSIFSDSVMLSLKSSVTYIRFGIFSVAIIKLLLQFFFLFHQETYLQLPSHLQSDQRFFLATQ